MAVILHLLLIVAGGYGIFVLLVYFAQASLLYFPTHDDLGTPAQLDLAYETVRISTEDGLKLHGWFLPAQHSRGVLLFLHGNAGNITYRLDSLKIFHDLGLSVLIFDYRGYGESEGKMTESGSYLDAQAAWRYLIKEKSIPAQKIVLFGRSLGGAIAAHLAAQKKPGALIIESSFTSVPDLAAHLYPFLPTRWLSRFHYNTKDALQGVACPVLIIHSRDDEIIPVRHGRELYAAAPEPKRFLELSGSHNEGFLSSKQIYTEGVDNFIKTYLEN